MIMMILNTSDSDSIDTDDHTSDFTKLIEEWVILAMIVS